jgi:hypothetical protein
MALLTEMATRVPVSVVQTVLRNSEVCVCYPRLVEAAILLETVEVAELKPTLDAFAEGPSHSPSTIDDQELEYYE